MVYAGTIIEISNKKTYVFTMDCGVVALRTRGEYILGQQIIFTKRDKYPELIRSVSMKTLAMAAAFLLLITSAATAVNLLQHHNQSGFDTVATALVSVDINPSIEISINKSEQIVSAQAKNEDGIKVLNELDLTGKPLVDGVNAVISAAKDMGYINESKKVILVSAALYDSANQDASSEYADQLKQILSTLEIESNNADLLTVYIDDSAIINEAKENNLSIGKELLYKYAQTQEAPLTAEQIRTSSLNDLLDKLNAIKKDGNLVETIQNPTTTSPAIQETHPQTPAPAAEKPVAETPKPAAKPEPAKNEFEPNLKVSVKGSAIGFDWTGLSGSSVDYKGKEYYGFKYYKVVASQTNNHPVYPDDGYLAVISDYGTSYWTLNPADGNYNCSPSLCSDVTYYTAITYVFENGKFTSDTKKITVPAYDDSCEDDSCDESGISISSLGLTMSSDGDNLKFSWTPVCGSTMTYGGKTYKDFNFYKVVASQTNSHPVYPDDGYLTYITDCNSSSWSLNPHIDSYNQSPQLESGVTYYFSITYVFGSGKVSSNTIQYTVP